MIGKIVALLDTPNIERKLKAAAGPRWKATADKTTDTKAIRQRIATLEKNIAEGVERLLLLDGDDQNEASAMLADWRSERRSLEDKLKAATRTGNAAPGCPAEREAARFAAELAHLQTTFAKADPQALRNAVKGFQIV
ncbi:hypothetical protein LF1_29470 [Rubripirellula obstinata]|uniref:Uncharacterized protein n=1 Tax=Rubripirellula obstinata TaxID=406547 RepID=A0A5B1CGT6_9BACT|nr:hypothetical protein [Rubripirellula obstinata]KAA1260407.1 hypothetical protein LF1_29470 [Rubripirellula obstinata]